MSKKVSEILGKIKADNQEKTLLSSNKVMLGIKEAIAELRGEVDFIKQQEQSVAKQASKAKTQILKIAADFINSANTSAAAAEGSLMYVTKELEGFGANDVVQGAEKAYDSFESEYMTFVRAMQDVEDGAKSL
tara:strand:- start:5609 stop:6007 length:399 start_codon:yes stop_codon:yes gene_type:complete